MKQTAPAAFDAAKFYQGVQTFQDWNVFPGRYVAGIKPVVRDLNLLGVPEHLEGSPRVLRDLPRTPRQNWMWLQARRIARSFAPGLEGFNSASVTESG